MSDSARTWKPFWLLVVFGSIVGFALGFVALLLEMNCHSRTYGYPGLGHAMFPLAGWANHQESLRYTLLPMILALTQFPIYGACVGVAHKKWKWGAWIALAIIAALHVALYGVSVIDSR